MVAGVSRSDFSEAAAGNSILLGIMTSGTGTFENQNHSIITGKVTLFNTIQQYEIIIQKIHHIWIKDCQYQLKILIQSLITVSDRPQIQSIGCPLVENQLQKIHNKAML